MWWSQFQGDWEVKRNNTYWIYDYDPISNDTTGFAIISCQTSVSEWGWRDFYMQGTLSINIKSKLA